MLSDISGGIGQEKEGGVSRILDVKTVDVKGLTLILLVTASSDTNYEMSIELLLKFSKHVSKTAKSSANFHRSGKSTPR
jgi:hypothetical protein